MNKQHYFTTLEIFLLLVSIIIITVSFFVFKQTNYLIFTASLIGVTSLIFNAKGNPLGQLLIIVFSILYGIISYSFAYYGEMITYLGMTMPMAIFSLITWLKNPYNNDKKTVKVNLIKTKELLLMFLLAIVVTICFYFILKAFATNNLITSTISVATSFVAAYLTYRRSKLFPIAYALNDIVLIILWILASLSDTQYFSVTICFFIFLLNDIYGFISWHKMEKKQQKEQNSI